MILEPGFFDVPHGMLAAVVTHLEMRQRPALRPAAASPGVQLVRKSAPDRDWYRALFLEVGGRDWLWFSRLALPDAALDAILADPDVAIFALNVNGRDAGLLELDFRDPGACELAFLGVSRDMIGMGAGRLMMNVAIEQAWARPIGRFHVHTCTLDHPAALAFYERSGFTVTRRTVEIAPDPRLSGVLPRDAAPHIPLIA